MYHSPAQAVLSAKYLNIYLRSRNYGPAKYLNTHLRSPHYQLNIYKLR